MIFASRNKILKFCLIFEGRKHLHEWHQNNHSDIGIKNGEEVNITYFDYSQK